MSASREEGRSNGSSSRVSRPASMREMSRMSFTTRSWRGGRGDEREGGGSMRMLFTTRSWRGESQEEMGEKRGSGD